MPESEKAKARFYVINDTDEELGGCIRGYATLDDAKAEAESIAGLYGDELTIVKSVGRVTSMKKTLFTPHAD